MLSEKSKNFVLKKVTQIRVSQIRVSQIRASQIRATEISSNHRKLRRAIFHVVHVNVKVGQTSRLNKILSDIHQRTGSPFGRAPVLCGCVHCE